MLKMTATDVMPSCTYAALFPFVPLASCVSGNVVTVTSICAEAGQPTRGPRTARGVSTEGQAGAGRLPAVSFLWHALPGPDLQPG